LHYVVFVTSAKYFLNIYDKKMSKEKDRLSV